MSNAIIGLWALLLGFGARPSHPLGPTDVAVIRAALDGPPMLQTRRESNRPGWLLLDRTMVACRRHDEEACVPSEAALPLRSPSRQTLPDLELTNIRSVSETQIRPLLRGERVDDEWQQFRRTFTNVEGYLAVSLPVYGASDARLYVTAVCGNLCGAGWIVQLHEVNGIWRVRDRSVIWMS
jgi:hypothetical protein